MNLSAVFIAWTFLLIPLALFGNYEASLQQDTEVRITLLIIWSFVECFILLLAVFEVYED